MPHFSSSMGNRRKRKRSKKRSSKQKAHSGSEDVLSAELRDQLPVENGSNMLVLSTDHKKQRPKKKKREEDPPKMSRKKAKLQRIKRRKERERLLADMYTSLRQKKLGAVEVSTHPKVHNLLWHHHINLHQLLWCSAAGTYVEHTPSWPGKRNCVMLFPC